MPLRSKTRSIHIEQLFDTQLKFSRRAAQEAALSELLHRATCDKFINQLIRVANFYLCGARISAPFTTQIDPLVSLVYVSFTPEPS